MSDSELRVSRIFFEHMMFNGSSKYKPTEFDKILESGGGYSNAFTSNDITFYYEEFNSDLLEKVLIWSPIEFVR